jgi:hypothetical protein
MYKAHRLNKKLRDVGTRCAILAPPNNTTNATQKTALPTMTVCRRFHKLPPLTSAIFLNIWLTYAPEKTFCFVYSQGELS